MGITQQFSNFSIVILCIFVILAFLLVLIVIIPFLIYDYIKTKIYCHTFFIPPRHELYIEISKWLSENISGPVWIEERRDTEREDFGYSSRSLGWTVRFVRKTDAMAFKLVWTGII